MASEKSDIRIISGNVTGTYYPTAGAFCSTVNNNSRSIYCSVLMGNGSIASVKYLRKNPKNFALIQHDVADDAHRSQHFYKYKKPFKKLRKVFATANEALTFVVRKDSGINSLKDFEGKRISFGSRANGTSAIIDKIIKAKQWKNDYLEIVELNSSSIADKVCSKDVDIIAFTVSHPNGLVEESLKSCDTKIISLSEEEIKELVKSNTFLMPHKIDKKFYNLEDDVMTLSVQSGVYTTSDLPDDIVYHFTKTILSDLQKIQALHPALLHFNINNMVLKNNAIIPTHDGALKYFEEKGLVK